MISFGGVGRRALLCGLESTGSALQYNPVTTFEQPSAFASFFLLVLFPSSFLSIRGDRCVRDAEMGTETGTEEHLHDICLCTNRVRTLLTIGRGKMAPESSANTARS